MFWNKQHIFLFIVLIAIIFTACSKQLHPIRHDISVLYPLPPDTARIQFLTRFSNSSDFEGKQSKFKTFIAGQENPSLISKPYGIGLYNGKLYIADAGIAGIHIINFDIGSFDSFTPGGRGKLKIPINCIIDKDENLYVTDVGRNQVVIFNKDLDYIGEIGGNESFKPTDAVISGDTLYVCDPNNNRINAYDKTDHDLLFSFPESLEPGKDNWLYNPLNLCLGNNKIYVTDFGDSKIKLHSLNGKYLNEVGSYGSGLAQFVRPKGIAVDREENLFVVDAGFENIQIFNKGGVLLMYFGGPYKGPGDMYLPANVIVDYDHLKYFEKYVDSAFNLKYLIFVTNQYGPDKVSVYGRIDQK